MLKERIRRLIAVLRFFVFFSVLLALSSNAQADTYLYTFANDATSFSFQIDSQPTVDSSNAAGFEVPIATTPAFPDIMFAQFYPSSNLGGIAFADDVTFAADGSGTVLQYDGPQLYSGGEDTPTLLLGTGSYLLFNTFDHDLIATLTVSQVTAIPEASTWAMMMVGFVGLVFLSYRRRTEFGRLA